MNIKPSYSIKPLEPNIAEVNDLINPESNKIKSELTDSIFPFIFLALMLIGLVWFVKSALWGIFLDQSHLAAYGWVYCGGFAILITLISDSINKNDMNERDKLDKEYQKLEAERNANKEARKTAEMLNNLIHKSKELEEKVIPYFLNSISENLKKCEDHLKNKAINNYFDAMEFTITDIACYKDIIDDLKNNSNIYSTTLTNRNHNFPTTFPISILPDKIKPLLSTFEKINYEADKTPEFAMVFNQRKLIAVNIAGFTNVKQAIDNAADRISSSIDDLTYAVNSGFSTLNRIQKEHHKTYKLNSGLQFEYQNKIDENLSRINSKLYYIQYNKKPYTPFNRFDA
jgi:hypothetical protein